MRTESLTSTSSQVKQAQGILQIERLIALWALSEAALGGVLHALRIPFTGLFVNSSAVLFMVLIANTAQKKGAILRATLIVMIVKGMVSPHTPLTAFIAVGFQGFVGELLLPSKKHLLLSSILLGVITLLQSGLQKIVLLTIVFGNTLWESIDIFGSFVLNQLSFLSIEIGQLNISYWLISTYIGIHLIAGICIGILAARVPRWITQEIKKGNKQYIYSDSISEPNIRAYRKKKSWLHKKSNITIFILALAIIVGSYLFPEISKTQGIQAVIMIVRSICIMFLWYFFFGPVLIKMYQRFIKSRGNTYTNEIQKTLHILPSLRFIIYKTWDDSRNLKGYRRFKFFITLALVNILSAEFHTDETN
jgi:hypothetical protein